MPTRRWIAGMVLIGTLCVLVACAPAYDGRTTEDVGRTTIVAATRTAVPTWTATPTSTSAIPLRPTIELSPTFTSTPTLTPTPTRTLTPAEALAARLPALGGWVWRADGDAVKLYDAKDQAVAVLNQKSGALRWDSKEHFKAIEPYLIKDDLKQQLAEKLTEWKQQGIRFITFPDSEGRKEIPPYIVIPTADGKSVQMIPARKGTADFVYNADAKKVMGVFPDGSGYYYLNPDGSFDLKPLEAQANDIADKLLASGVIQHPDPAKAKFIRDATASAIMINPYGVTPKEINDFIKSRTGKDFAEHFNRTWGDIVGVTYEEVMAATLAKSPSDLFRHLDYIGQNTEPRCQNTCWAVLSGKNYIFIVEKDISAGAYYPLPITLVKEAYGSKSRNIARQIATIAGKLNEISQQNRGAHIGEALSFAIQAYTLNQHPEISPYSSEQITASIDSAFRGGWVVK